SSTCALPISRSPARCVPRLRIFPPCLLLSSAGGTAHYFNNLLGDGRLAHFVHVQGERLDHLARIFCRRLHSGHARCVLRCRRLQHSALHLRLHVTRQKPIEQLFFRLLVDVVHLRTCLATSSAFLHLFGIYGKKLFHGQVRGHHGLEFAENDVYGIDLAFGVQIRHHVRNLSHHSKFHPRQHIDVFGKEVKAGLTQSITAF